jgi:hypothetical protein
VPHVVRRRNVTLGRGGCRETGERGGIFHVDVDGKVALN